MGQQEVAGRVWSPWRTVVWFGLVSLAADMVYEGARAITGPFLASLGASALVVGLVTGAGEGAALVLRLVSGPLADRTGRYWSLTIVGYGLTAVCVPLMAIAPFVGGAGLAVGATLVVLERTGKAIRSPSKSALLAHAAGAVGRGRGFGVHKALDQVGAFSGPLLVAGVVALTGRLWTALAVLAVPAALSMVLLLVVRARVPDLAGADQAPQAVPAGRDLSGVARGEVRLPGSFYLFAGACAASTVGLMTFGVISYHLVEAGVFTLAWVPVVYAAAMASGAVAALATGGVYDRFGGRVLLLLPVLVAAVPLLAFDTRPAVVLAGVLVWGAATGLQDSTVKALVADLVPSARLATAYGVFAAFQGAAALAGGALAGALYDGGVADLVLVIAGCQVLALALLVVVLRRPRAGDGPGRRH
ncbi:MFS transporter [Nocardioides sp.]|uniref:MFS transporter n=1 Tax=Nocardioides sp. TaxID=35761 RepID=UPI00356283DB